ncbi:MAG: hypothetical protein IJT94_12335, partial [Oscillibacter sp.]|nr:hypothetical protein [Oscillibacter sp.]
ALRTYPLGYPRADAEEELLDTALEPGADDYYFRYYHWRETADEPDPPEGTPLTVRPWKIEWLDYDGSVRARVFLGTGSPPEDEVHPGEGIAPLQEDPALIYAFTGWNWAEREVHEETRIVTVSPVYTSKPRRRIVWLKEDGTELASADYGQGDEVPAAPAVPEKASEYPAWFRYAGSWTASGIRSDEYGVPVTAMKPVYSTVAERRYTVRWLEFDADTAEEVDRKTAVPGQTEPVTGRIPVMTDADSFYPFTGWGRWTMDTASGVKTYAPAFSDYGEPLHTITWVWKGSNGSSRRKSVYYGNAALSAAELAALTPNAAYQRGDEVHDLYTWDITTDGSTTTYTAVYAPLEGGNG